MRWKGDISDMPMDWWEGKVAYCKYKGQMTIIKDDYGKDYKVSDLQAFKNIQKSIILVMGKVMEAYMKRTDIGFESLKIFIII